MAKYPIYTYTRGTPIGEEVNQVLVRYQLNAMQRYEDEITIGGMVARDPRAVGLVTLTIGLNPLQSLKELIIEGIPTEFHRIYLITLKDDFRPNVLEEFMRFTASFEPPEWAVPRLKSEE